MTSVKEFRIDEPATADSLGRGSFVFTDDYSVFDWGKMPDQIPRKGASLCAMGAFNFELLEDNDIPTHYEGVRTDDTDGLVDLDTALSNGTAPTEMGIALTQVPNLPEDGGEYDYDAYHRAAGDNYLIPVEIVFRNRVPIGSSLRTRTDPRDHGLEFDSWPDRTVELDKPIIEFSTKYEEQDRYLDREEADRITGTADRYGLESVARSVNRVVTDRAEAAGLTHEDGKIECLYHDGTILVADVVGTFDENRFSYQESQLSKEVIRQYHKRTQPQWVEAVSEAKGRANREGIADWKSLCDRDPEPLADTVVTAASDLYCAGTNAYLDLDMFDAPGLDEAIEAVDSL
jgi:phosphoribosylaminoimidazole-succinocarboxamide synthase